MNEHTIIEPPLRQEYVRSGLGNLRCFPCCTDGGNHRTNTFCGDSIKVGIVGQHPNSRLLGKFRLMNQPHSFEVGQSLDADFESTLMEAKFVSALRNETRYSFNPPRRWSSTIRENGAHVCFTMYLVSTCDQRLVEQVIDSTPFRIVTRTEEDDDASHAATAAASAAASTSAPPIPQRHAAAPSTLPSNAPSTTTSLPYVAPKFQPIMMPLFPQQPLMSIPPPQPPIMVMPPPPPHYYLPPQTFLPSHAPPPLSLNLEPLSPHQLPASLMLSPQATSPPSYFLNPFQVDVNVLRSQLSPRRRSSELQQQPYANEAPRKRSKSDEA